jgi:hypothetical protein
MKSSKRMWTDQFSSMTKITQAWRKELSFLQLLTVETPLLPLQFSKNLTISQRRVIQPDFELIVHLKVVGGEFMLHL